MSGWSLALRLARREAWRAKGRSVLVLVMISLPVLAVTAALVVMKTSDVNGSESADRRLGTADARIWTEGPGAVVQGPDPEQTGRGFADDPDDGPRLTPAGIAESLGREVRAIPVRASYQRILFEDRAIDADLTEVDLSDPLAEGVFRLTDGRLPSGPDEVVVNHSLSEKGIALGDRLELAQGGDATPTVVGVAESATIRDRPVVAGPTGSLLPETGIEREEWLVDAGAPVTWSEVLGLNQQGGFVLSRAVLADPPDVEALANELGVETGASDVITVLALVVTMALLEVVLLAGPAFAVGARRLSRSLALISASGGTPRQARRVVLAGGVVLGGVAAVLGCLLGILVGWALLPLAQRFSNTWFGPFEVPWLWLLAVVAFGLASALLAAVVPAYLASKQDVVAVLAGRRGDAPPRWRTPVLGLVLLGVGIAGAAWGARPSDNGEYLIAASAVVSVLGMLLVVPVVVGLVARVAGRLPLVVRYAARDAARHRTRTVPAVAAVAATVAGVVALGIASASDEAGNVATYEPMLPRDVGMVTIYDDLWMDGPADDTEAGAAARADDWEQIASLVETQLPGVRAERLSAIREASGDGSSVYLNLDRPGQGHESLLESYGRNFRKSVLVADEMPDVVPGISEAARAATDEALAAGRAVVFTTAPVEGDTIRVRPDLSYPDQRRTPRLSPIDLPATFVAVGTASPPTPAMLPTTLAEEVATGVGREVTTVALVLLDADITADQLTKLTEAVGGVDDGAEVYVERGYQRGDEATIVLLILGSLGGVLMLGGTLTATFLALSDARPDLATLSAVGASPRSRRGVAASYAVVVGLVGALLGAAVGFIPGVAISRPLTRTDISASGTGPFLDIPWLLIGTLVVALPLVTALVVGLTARSRLPMVARLD